jgi:DNA-directed RNA polymerase specialized sigma24 family protein
MGKEINVKDLKIDRNEFEEKLDNYINIGDEKSEKELFNDALNKICHLVLYRMNIPDSFPIFQDLLNQAMYKCFMAIKNGKFKNNYKNKNPFSYFYTIVFNNTIVELKKHHKHYSCIKYSSDILPNTGADKSHANEFHD